MYQGSFLTPTMAGVSYYRALRANIPKNHPSQELPVTGVLLMADQPIDYSKSRVLTSSQEQREDQQIKDFEAAIAKIKNEYYLYFVGTNPKPPYLERNKLDALVRKTQMNLPKRTAQRFKMQQVLIKYQNMAEHWDRSLRGLEAGEKMPWVPLSRKLVKQHDEALENPQAAAPKPAAARANGSQASAYLAALRDPAAQEDDVRKIFNSYVAAKSKLGGDAGLSFEKFQQVISKQTSSILAKGASAVQFRIEISDEKVSLKAKALKD